VTGVLPIIIFHIRMFGTPFRTTYSIQDPPSLKHLGACLSYYCNFTIDYGIQYIVIGGAIYGLFTAFRKNHQSRLNAIAACVFIVSHVLFYSILTYDFLDRRYVLPALILVVLLFAFGFFELVGKSGLKNQKMVVTLVVIFSAVIAYGSFARHRPGKHVDHEVFQQIQNSTEQNAIILATEWCSTIRHYCHRKSYFLWTQKAVADSAIQFFLDRKIPVYILSENEGDTVHNHIPHLAQRFVLKQLDLYSGNHHIILYKILGYASDADSPEGLIIPSMGSRILFDGYQPKFEGPGIIFSLIIFAGSTKSKFIHKSEEEGLVISGPWRGFLFRLIPEYRASRERIKIAIEYKDLRGDFVCVHATDDDLDQSKRIQLTNTGVWKTMTIPLRIHPRNKGEIRIQNNNDNDRIIIRTVRVFPENPGKRSIWLSEVEQKIRSKISLNKHEQIAVNDRHIKNWTQLSKQLKSVIPRQQANALLNILAQPQGNSLTLSDIQELLSAPYFMVRYYMLLYVQKNDLQQDLLTDIKNCLKDEFALIRRTAAIVLLQKGDETGIPVLIMESSSSSFWEKRAAEKVLRENNIPFHKKLPLPESELVEKKYDS